MSRELETDMSPTNSESPTNSAQFLKRKSEAIYRSAKKLDASLSAEQIQELCPAELTVRLEFIEQFQDSFNLAHNSLEELDYNEIGSDLRDNFDDLLLSLKSRLRVQLENRQSTLPPSTTLRHDDNSLEQRNATSIRSHRTLPEFKFILSRRFHNKRLVFQAHIKEILGLQTVDSTSAAKLREFLDKVNAHMGALQTLGDSKQISGCMLIYLLLQKLDTATQTSWEENASQDKIPSAEEFFEYLERRCEKLESAQQPNRKAFVAAQTNHNCCLFCDITGHGIYSCSRFVNLSPTLRFKEVKKLALCINCLKMGHSSDACCSGRCRKCGSKHHTLLHFDTQHVPSQQSPVSSKPHSSNSVATQVIQPDVVLLATAVILVKNSCGSLVPCRAILDGGSQLHLVTSRFAHELQLKRTRSSTTVSGLGDTHVPTEGSTVNICMQSRVSEYSANLRAVITQTITHNQPRFPIDTADWNIPAHVKLADPAFNVPQRVDLLIGASLFYDLLCVGQIKLAPGFPLIQKTRLCWVVTGGSDGSRNTALITAQSCEEDNDAEMGVPLDDLVRRFWEVESCEQAVAKLSKEEQDCENHFRNNFVRLSSGEYEVRLPLKTSAASLGESYTQAYRRLLNLERKLQRQPNLKNQYTSFIKEYLDLNYISLVSPELVRDCKYFLPHHCVLKEHSPTTKLRVVFDGSAATSSGYSLNEVMMAGPVIQPKLFHILLRFRSYQFALTGDICNMYRCVKVASPDSYYQCILWRDAPDKDVNVYKLDTVTYGTKAASFLSVRTMHQLAIDERNSFPVGSVAVQQDFYVDDFISGGNSVQETINKMHQTVGILSRGNFKLRKWCSSHPEVLQDVAEDDKEKFLKFDEGSDVTLGLAWDAASDQLLFSFSSLETSSKPCRRLVLATIARFYDPLGLLGPVIAKSKIFLQQLCKDKLMWNESLPLSRNTAWQELCSSFQSVQRISFPRFVLDAKAHYEIHGFCDASEEAYGACIYVVSKNHSSQSHLLCSKSRVAPLKTQSIPKLELCGAVLLAKLMNEIRKLGIFVGQFHCWSDSSAALSWIHNEPDKFNVFVANRVTSIQKLTVDMEWHHVPTTLNPADIITIGAFPEYLAQSEMWFHGPPYLVGNRDAWPTRIRPDVPTLELRKSVLKVQSPHVDISTGCKYLNSFVSMQCIFACIYKFIKRIRHHGLNTTDVHHGTLLLMRAIQLANLWDDVKELRSNGFVRKSSAIASLAPFIDDFGLIRVGGRLSNSTLPYESRHPIILPRRHPVVLALIAHLHKTNLHIGPRALLAKIRLQYWPIGGLRTVSGAFKNCITCFKAKPGFLEPIMANLPKERLPGARAFAVSGVDYCGPFFYKSEVCTRPPIKCFICIFICFTSKAVHMELVKDLTTASFLSALKRFIATCGKPSQLWSDNATNFVGAKNELSDLKALLLSDPHMEAVHRFCLTDSIDWQFIPPRSPHFEGLWEAAVKTAKHQFIRSVNCSNLTFDDLRNLVCQISAIINSRPLHLLSENPEDLDVLTPAHLLFGGPQTNFIEPDLTKLNYNRLDAWQRVTQLQQVFWARWREEYITLLQQRCKWSSPDRRLKVNDVVLIKHENLPPMRWPLARVVSLIPGQDGECRVAELKTAVGNTRRAINKLCMLPLDDAVETEASNGGSMSGAAASQEKTQQT